MPPAGQETQCYILTLMNNDDDDDVTGGGSSDESDVETEPGLTLRRKVRMENYGTCYFNLIEPNK